jgi:mono/diheme cytochrome c family protein
MKTGFSFAVAALATAGALYAQTAQQIGAGRASYGTMCAGCHAPDLGAAAVDSVIAMPSGVLTEWQRTQP